MENVKRCFRKIRESDLETIMEWRMRPDITKFMYTDPKLTIEEQKKWFEKISKDKDSFYRIIDLDGMPVGLICLVDWDKENSIIHSGGYIAEKEGRSLQNIVDVNMNLYDYAFSVLNVNKSAFEIMSNNMNQVRWMKRIGATVEGIARQAIRKNGEYYDLYLMSILKEEWDLIRNKNHFNKYEIE